MKKWSTVLLTLLCGVLLIGSAWFALTGFNDTPVGSMTASSAMGSPHLSDRLSASSHPKKSPQAHPIPSPTQRKSSGAIQLHGTPMGTEAVKQAMDAIGAEDEKTRRTALKLLAHCTPADLAAIEPFIENPNPRIREQANFQHQRLSGTILAFEAVYPDGEPAENVKLEFTIHLALTPEERQAMGGLQQDIDLLTPVASTGESMTDATGLAPAAALADGDYVAYIGASGAVPDQNIKQGFHLTANTQVVRVQILRGCNVAIRVLDKEGHPIENATVLMPWTDPRCGCPTTSEMLRQARERTEPHMTNGQGRCALGTLGRRAVNIAAAKPGYSPVCEYSVALRDCEFFEKVLTLEPAPPGMVTLQLPPLTTGVGPSRVVVLEATLFRDWYAKKTALMANDEATRMVLLQAGGLDAGTCDTGGNVKVILAPDNYVAFVFIKGNTDLRQGFCEIRHPLPGNPIEIALQSASR